MVAEDGGEGEFMFYAQRGEFEDGGLGIGSGFAVDLVTGEDDEVGFFGVEDGGDEGEGAGVGGALSAVRGGLSFAADSGAGGEV